MGTEERKARMISWSDCVRVVRVGPWPLVLLYPSVLSFILL
jgi:hypothetical protein